MRRFVSAEVGLNPPDVPKAMALVLSESIDHPDEMRELARAGWVPREAEGFTALSFLGRGRLGAWVASARSGVAEGGGGLGAAAARAGVVPAAPLWRPRPRRSPPKEPAPAALADSSMVDEARVPLT